MIRIVGAVCIDIVARRDAFAAGTSNPSRISVEIGGVGYRVYRGLTAPARFLTAIGDDGLSALAGRALAADPSASVRVIAAAGPAVYLALMEHGRLAVGASDLAAIERLDAADAVAWIGEPAPGDLLVLDANLAPELVVTLVDRFARRMRVVFEPVSVEKAARCRSALHDLFLVTPTEEEATALADGSDFAGWMAGRRIVHAVVTRGPEGAELWTGGTARHLAPSRIVAAADTTGAGDRLLAALLDGLHGGCAMDDALLCAAMETVETWLEKGSA
jgi:sugar/nucleoside kinase (ribokinase family)